eukprot:TRINITY_DN2931_c0_g1_i1.p1 TRINITY_DN2931_c0_g1~~TRINITY_DN2931_c0_g1_i1.p1  ORF type:complete len:467 (+),score=69.61 TRINITY_DN2931_c0_g1_i1:282-1682(+)
MEQKLLFLVILATLITLTTQRRVNCQYSNLPIHHQDLQLYQSLFSDFEETDTRSGREVLVFQTLASLSSVATGGVDLTETIVTANSLERQIKDASVPLSVVQEDWFTTWLKLGNNALSAGDSFLQSDDTIGAASAYHRACMYYQLSLRLFTDHFNQTALDVYTQSTRAFIMAINLKSPLYPNCQLLEIPYYDNITGIHVNLHGYFCGSTLYPVGEARTILLLTGYDGSAEGSFHSAGVTAAKYGFNVIIVEGPGQGYTVRKSRLPFRPDYEYVSNQILKFAFEHLNIDPNTLIIWGRSFGGYLAPRIFAKDTRFQLLVADGGVYDFFQSLFCKLPPLLQELFYHDPAKFDTEFELYKEYSLQLNFFMSFGKLGFNVSSASGIYNKLMEYELSGVMDGFANRTLFVNHPELDTLTGNQSMIFYDHLPKNSNVKLKSESIFSGAALHCSVGSTSVSISSILSWLVSHS